MVYHGIINGYLSYARRLGFEHAHIWVAPPQSGDEYIFHCRLLHPKHGRGMMSMQKLRTWYETLLEKAKDEGSKAAAGFDPVTACNRRVTVRRCV